MRGFALLSALAVVLAAPASAAVVTGGITGGSASPGTFEILVPPFTVGDDDQQANTKLFAFNERQNVALGSNLALDLGGTLLAGTRVASHGVVFDPLNSRTVEGFVTFDRPILGLIWLTSKLNATDAALGLASITYDIGDPARGLEGPDRTGTSFSGNTLFIDWTASSPGDNIRVLTAAVPEPATWAMLIAGFGLVGVAARRNRRQLGSVTA